MQKYQDCYTSGEPPARHRSLSQSAETCAILAAAQFVQQCPHESADIYTDSTFAQTEHSRTLQGLPCYNPDIGTLLSQTSPHKLRQTSPHKLRLHKTKAHQNLQELWGFPLWEAAGNAFADVSAKAAATRDFQFLQDMLSEISEEELTQHAALHLFHRFLLDLSADEWAKKQAPRPSTNDLDQEAANTPANNRDDAWLSLSAGPSLQWECPALDHSWVMASNWPPWFTVPLFSWLSCINWQDDANTGPGVTGLELLVDFVLCTSCIPPIKSSTGQGYVNALDTTLHAPTTIRSWAQC